MNGGIYVTATRSAIHVRVVSARNDFGGRSSQTHEWSRAALAQCQRVRLEVNGVVRRFAVWAFVDAGSLPMSACDAASNAAVECIVSRAGDRVDGSWAFGVQP